MTRSLLAGVYFAGLLFAEALRLHHRVRRARSAGSWHPPSNGQRFSEVLVLSAVLVGIWILPAVYLFTHWLSALDYSLASWAAWPALAVFLPSLLLRWRAQVDLGAAWSHTVELADGHGLVTSGIYGWIRHPIYASLILWAVAQLLLLQNAAAGGGGVVAVVLIWVVRVPAEEKMMRARFGDEYVQYANHTGRLIPGARHRLPHVNER